MDKLELNSLDKLVEIVEQFSKVRVPTSSHLETLFFNRIQGTLDFVFFHLNIDVTAEVKQDFSRVLVYKHRHFSLTFHNPARLVSILFSSVHLGTETARLYSGDYGKFLKDPSILIEKINKRLEESRIYEREMFGSGSGSGLIRAFTS